ncbi:MAG: hypothetical protein ACREFO_00825 [Acetobacteraceae bacterium]
MAFSSGFDGCVTGLEPEPVVAGFEDVKVKSERIEQDPDYSIARALAMKHQVRRTPARDAG